MAWWDNIIARLVPCVLLDVCISNESEGFGLDMMSVFIKFYEVYMLMGD